MALVIRQSAAFGYATEARPTGLARIALRIFDWESLLKTGAWPAIRANPVRSVIPQRAKFEAMDVDKLRAVGLGPGRVVALYYSASTSYQNR
jgi:hypothetical protein